MQIGSVTLPRTAALAPMAGVADRAFRELCREYGACYVVGEMASSKGLTYQSRKTAQLLTLSSRERPAAIQLFGDDPDTMAEAARISMQYRPDVLDINMGCPAPKIAGNRSGSALMKTPELAGRIIRAVRDAVPVPVTVKFRKGWDEDSVNAVEFAKMAEQSGASALTVHGRTRKQMYAPPVDRAVIRAVKEAVSIPVIANGDVTDVASARQMYDDTGADLIMVGRGALGAPWLFAQLEAWFLRGELLPEPSLEEKMEVMCRQAAMACEYKGEYVALREMRKHAACYLKGLRGAAGFRARTGSISTLQDLRLLAEQVLEENRGER